MTTRPSRRSVLRAAVPTGAAALLLSACGPSGAPARISQRHPENVPLQVTQGPGGPLTVMLGGVGAGSDVGRALVPTPDPGIPEPADSGQGLVAHSQLPAGPHLSVVSRDDGARQVRSQRVRGGVARLPGLADGRYAVGLVQVADGGWATGLGIVDLTIRDGRSVTASPSTLTRALPLAVEVRGEAGLRMVVGRDTPPEASPEAQWRMVGPLGERIGETEQHTAALDLTRDGDYRIELSLALEGAPSIILQSVIVEPVVRDGRISG